MRLPNAHSTIYRNALADVVLEEMHVTHIHVDALRQ